MLQSSYITLKRRYFEVSEIRSLHYGHWHFLCSGNPDDSWCLRGENCLGVWGVSEKQDVPHIADGVPSKFVRDSGAYFDRVVNLSSVEQNAGGRKII